MEAEESPPVAGDEKRLEPRSFTDGGGALVEGDRTRDDQRAIPLLPETPAEVHVLEVCEEERLEPPDLGQGGTTDEAAAGARPEHLDRLREDVGLPSGIALRRDPDLVDVDAAAVDYGRVRRVPDVRYEARDVGRGVMRGVEHRADEVLRDGEVGVREHDPRAMSQRSSL